MKFITNTKVLLAGSIAAMTLSIPSQSMANEFDRYVKAELDEWVVVLDGMGYAKAGDYHIDRMDDGDQDHDSIKLEAGYEYNIVGACDEDCGDIDFILTDTDGNVVDEDKEEDSTPLLDITPSSTQIYVVITKMYNCETNPCSFGYAVVRK